MTLGVAKVPARMSAPGAGSWRGEEAAAAGAGAARPGFDPVMEEEME